MPQIKLSFEKQILKTKMPFGISYGTKSDAKNILVKLTYENMTGYGEAAPAPYHGETIDTVMALLQAWSESDILGDDPFAISEINQKLDKFISENYAAKCAIDVALHDLSGKLANLSISKMLGLSGLQTQMPQTYFTIGLDTIEIIKQKTSDAIKEGFQILKVKQGTANGIEYDKQIIRSIREVAPNTTLRVDANGGWTPKQAVLMSHFLAEQKVQYIEQPIHKHSSAQDFKYVKDHSPIAIFADESVMRAKDIIRLADCVDGVVMKLTKTGGIQEGLKFIQMARACDLEVMIGCMLESSCGITAATHLAPLADYLDLDGALLLANDPFNSATCKSGLLELKDAPGLGISPTSLSGLESKL